MNYKNDLKGLGHDSSLKFLNFILPFLKFRIVSIVVLMHCQMLKVQY